MILIDLQLELKDFKIKKIEQADYGKLHKLHNSNPRYNAFFGERFVSLQNCIAGTKTLPPNTSADQKFYIGFYQSGYLTAVLDYIESYPQKMTVWIGLLMVDASYQRQAIAQTIVQHFLRAIEKNGFSKVQLAVIEDNHSALKFWRANGFIELGRRLSTKGAKVIIMENVNLDSLAK